MRQFVYISTATSTLGGEDILDIVQASSRNNAGGGITGFLIFNGRNFLQLIEGPEQSLDALMSRLASDARHTGIVKLADIAIDTRVCVDWMMKHIRLSESVDLRREELDRILPEDIAAHTRETILNFASLN